MNCTGWSIKMHIASSFRNRRGSGMVLSFFALMLVVAFGVSLVSIAWSSLSLSRRDALRARALACAEAGIDRAESFLLSGGPSGEEIGKWRTSHPSSDPNDHSGDTFYIMNLAPGETCRICARDGTGITAGKIVVTSIGTVTEGSITVTRTIRVVLNFRKENVCVWNNVIFGGVGQSGKSINGNVAIRGSVHLLGDGESFTDLDGDNRWDAGESYTDSNSNGQYDLGEPYVDTDGDGHRDSREPFEDVNGNGTRDPALTVTDMASEIAGTANLGNNYSGMPVDLRSRLPAPPQTVFNGELVETLNAKLRVKHGRVNISGSASVGMPNVAGNSIKETVDGTYVSDGFGGNKGTAGVYSDNGFTNGYDLSEGLVRMPVIDSGEYTKDGVTYSNYLAYLRANATVYSGNLSLQKGVATTISGPNGSLTLDAAGNLTVSGIVFVNGNISFGPSKSRIIYSGKGTLVTPYSVYVHCDLLPKTNFPRNDVLGLIAGDRIELATGSGDAQLTMAIAMYAQHKVISVKQSEIAGTMVSSYYEMSNVPKVYQVPELADNLPPGMPGDDPIWIVSLDVESWQEI